jgi:formylglycine-generating enzyme required for sulfatase activity
MMGSPLGEPFREAEEGLHEVTLSHDFWLGTTEVTQAQWRALMASNPSGFPECGDTCPVETISWLEAIAYANARSREEGLPECYLADGNVVAGGSIYECCGYRLPTEAEWEYAARAGTTTATYAGDLLGGPQDCASEGTVVNGSAWWCGNSGLQTHPVGEKAPNAFGLRDMLGNVWEWTHDWYGFNAGPITDPAVSTDVEGFGSRLLRGGGWINQAGLLRAAYRARALPTDAESITGLRLARTAL